MLVHILQQCAPSLGSHIDDIQRHISDLVVISAKDLESFINISDILQKNSLLSQQEVVQNIIFDKFLTKLMACQGLNHFSGTTNPRVTWKPDNTLKRILDPIPQKSDNRLRLIWDMVPKGIRSQWLRGLTVPT